MLIKKVLPAPYDPHEAFKLLSDAYRKRFYFEVKKGEDLRDGDFYLNSRGTWTRSMVRPHDVNTGWTTYIRKKSGPIPK